MKKGATPELTQKWWSKHKAITLKKTGLGQALKAYEDAKNSKDDKRILQALKDAHVKVKVAYKACDRKRHAETLEGVKKYDKIIKKEARDLDQKIKASRGRPAAPPKPSSGKPELSQKWWSKNRPATLKKTGLGPALKVYEDAKNSKDDKRILQALKDAHVKVKVAYKACDRKQHAGTIKVLEKYDQMIKKEARDLDQKIKASRGRTPRDVIIKVSAFAKRLLRLDGLDADSSKQVWNSLKRNGYIDSRGKVQDRLRTDLKKNTLKLPSEYSGHKGDIRKILRTFAG